MHFLFHRTILREKWQNFWKNKCTASPKELKKNLTCLKTLRNLNKDFRIIKFESKSIDTHTHRKMNG